MSTNPFAEIRKLLATPELPALGPTPRAQVLPASELKNSVDRILHGTTVSPTARELLQGALLLWHDHLDLAHSLVQRIENADGSLLHGIMHRREPDYFNAKYWFRAVGQHPCFPSIATKAKAFLALSKDSNIQNRLIPGNKWDPLAFVDLCQEAATQRCTDTLFVRTLQEIQRIECEAWLEYFGDRHGLLF